MEPFQAVGLALVVAAILGGGLEAAGRTPILPGIRKDGDRRP